jgi:hypothetical protein
LQVVDVRRSPWQTSERKKVLSLEEGWEVELWRSAYGVARFRLAQAAETPDLSADDAPETRDER